MEAGPTDRQLVFLGGLHRSGTTLLARALGEHSEVSSFSGTGAPADEGQHLQSVYPPGNVYGGPGRFGLSPEAHLTQDSPLATRENAGRLLAEWREHWDTSRRVLVEKSPPNLIRTRFLQALFPAASFVVLLRHPAAVALATAKWRRTRRLGALVHHWLHCHELFAADAPRLARLHVLRYEDLVADPHRALAGVYAFLGLEGEPVAGGVEAGSNERYFERWRELQRAPLMRAYLGLVDLRYEQRVRRFGYSLREPAGR